MASCRSSCISASVGVCPIALRAVPRSCARIVPFPALSKSLNASFRAWWCHQSPRMRTTQATSSSSSSSLSLSSGRPTSGFHQPLTSRWIRKPLWLAADEIHVIQVYLTYLSMFNIYWQLSRREKGRKILQVTKKTETEKKTKVNSTNAKSVTYMGHCKLLCMPYGILDHIPCAPVRHCP